MTRRYATYKKCRRLKMNTVDTETIHSRAKNIIRDKEDKF